MQSDLGGQFNLRDPSQGFAQNFRFELELQFVGNVLVMAATAAPKIRTPGLDTVRRRLNKLRLNHAREAASTGLQLRFDFFSRQSERNENRETAAVFVNRGASKTVAAVNQFFNGKKQASSVARHSTWIVMLSGANIPQSVMLS